MKTIIKSLLTLIILLAFSCSQETTLDPIPSDLEARSINDVSARAPNKAKASSKQTAPIGGLSDIEGNPITGTSTLHRNTNGITVNFKAEGLYPGAYTIWWVIWNNPEYCGVENACLEPDFPDSVFPPLDPNPDNMVGVEVMYAGGHVVGKNGKGNFSAHLNAGDDTPESMNTSFGFTSVGGLRVGNTFDAEIHVVLRTHGPAVPGLVNEQISSYGGGCDNPFLYAPFTFYPNVIGECGDIAAAIFAPVN
jgi:hypothetical protein